jgi:virginiamycin A acetyltransferase
MDLRQNLKEGKKSMFSSLILHLYGLTQSGYLRSLMRSLALRMEGGTVHSLTIREIYRRFHGVIVGLYTIGPCTMPPGHLARGTTVGRYSSIYYTVRTIAQDYPVNGSLPDGLFSDSALGERKTPAPGTDCTIGNDVFMGHNAIILPSVKQVGDGAVIGAGSVVQANVPPYAIVAGNPARVVRFRFSERKITELLDSKWWLKSIDELGEEIEEFRKPLEALGSIR